MLYIKLDDDMSLVITVNEPIYRGDNLSQKITYLIPTVVGEIDMLTASVFLSYVRADGVADVVVLDRSETPYNESYFQYTFPINCKLSKYPVRSALGYRFTAVPRLTLLLQRRESACCKSKNPKIWMTICATTR